MVATIPARTTATAKIGYTFSSTATIAVAPASAWCSDRYRTNATVHATSTSTSLFPRSTAKANGNWQASRARKASTRGRPITAHEWVGIHATREISVPATIATAHSSNETGYVSARVHTKAQ